MKQAGIFFFCSLFLSPFFSFFGRMRLKKHSEKTDASIFTPVSPLGMGGLSDPIFEIGNSPRGELGVALHCLSNEPPGGSKPHQNGFQDSAGSPEWPCTDPFLGHRSGPAPPGSKNRFSSKRAFQTISGPLQIDPPFDTIPKGQKISIFR